MDIKKSSAAALFVLGLTLTASATQAGVTRDITVNFDGSGCPLSVDRELLNIQKSSGDKVRWMSKPEDKVFEVFFDPFKGSPIKANPKGVTNPKSLDGSVPVGLDFKYTIYSSVCPQSPLDPRIRIF